MSCTISQFSPREHRANTPREDQGSIVYLISILFKGTLPLGLCIAIFLREVSVKIVVTERTPAEKAS